MNSLLLVSAILLTGADASFADAAADVGKAADGLASQVKKWSEGDGLAGALGIQTSGFPPLSSAVGVLSQSAGSLKADDVDVSGTNSLADSIVGLLGALSDRAKDFKSIHADSIVQNDLKELQGPSVDIVNSLVAAVKDDCDKVGSLTSALSAFGGAFNKVDDAYGLQTSSWPAAPDCKGGSGGKSDSGSKSSGGAGKSSGGAAKSSAPQESASGPAKESSGSSAKKSSGGGSKPAESSVTPSNGGAAIALGAGAGLAGVVALLI